MTNEVKQKEMQGIERTHSGPTYLPLVDIYEKEGTLFVVAEMPGVDEKNVEVNFEKGVLTVRGQAEEKPEEGMNWLLKEYNVGNYERTFSVAESIDIERVEAKMKNGLDRKSTSLNSSHVSPTRMPSSA